MRSTALKAGILISGIALPAAGIAAASDDDTPNPYLYPNDSYISLNGTVKGVGTDSFTLDFRDGSEITVEMDDGDRDADAYKLNEGDHVTVYGQIDDDFFEVQTIEANSVYIDKLDTFFYASAIDEEDYEFVTATEPENASELVVQGSVTDVSGSEFRMDTGEREFEVEVAELPSDPLDDEGYQQIEVGDVVSVTGEIDYGFVDGRQLVADTVTTINDWDS